MCFKENEIRFCIFPVFLLLCLIQFNYCDENVISNITVSQTLSRGQTLVSPSQSFELGFFSPEYSVNQYVGIRYRGITPQRLVWVANRETPLNFTDSLASLRFNRNGNLEVFDGANNSLWSTNIISGPNSSIAVLEDSGNFVIRDAVSGQELWESFEETSDTFLAGSVLGFNERTGETRVLRSWKSDGDASLGNFSVGISRQKPTQAFVWRDGSIPVWRSGPWDKSSFVGVPNMDSSYQSPLSIQEDFDKGTTNLVFIGQKSISIQVIAISPSGVLAWLIKETNGNDNVWVTSWEAPKRLCESYGVCGPFGLCKDDETRNCECLKGFVPESSEEWSRGIWTRGCVRRIELHCESDGFQKIPGLKLPDFYESVTADSADDCRAGCANNCSCVAFTYVTGIGCLTWSGGLVDIQEFSSGGEDLFLRLAQIELRVEGQKFKRIIISVSVVAFFIVVAAVVLVVHLRRAKHRGRTKQSKKNLELTGRKDISKDRNRAIAKQNDLSETQTFDLDTILVATNNFSEENKLGQGGFGPVYKGKLHDGRELAVKRLSTRSNQGIEEFKNEATLISKLQHRNLVKLIGCCSEKDEKILIYEFMPNKSLDFFIFDPSKSSELNWATRFNVILGVGRGLLYLHRDSCLRIIHRDLKVGNILLDEKMDPKISDFGLSRIFEGTSDIANTHKVVGTIGYMSPEYALAGDFSEKSDIFSFGVLMLEIVSGKKNTTSFNNLDDKHLSLISYAWQLWSENRGLDLVDDALAESYSSQEVTRCINIGLLCVQDHAEDRPTMPDVVFMLSNETNRPQPKRPTFTIQRPHRSEFRDQSNKNKLSVNKLTISHLIEGR